MLEKDHFSAQSKLYAQYRPTYPAELYQFIFDHVSNFNLAWDCGCGNGQVSVELAERFKQVIATDISENQISHASPLPNINYKVSQAENSGLDTNSADLITVGQALHWFNFDAFFAEVKRVAKPKALLAAWTYTLNLIDENVDALVLEYYAGIVGDYWAKERAHVDARYKTIPFPFKRIDAPEMFIEKEMTAGDYINYLETWSASAKYLKETGQQGTSTIRQQLYSIWPEDEVKKVRWPMVILAGYVT